MGLFKEINCVHCGKKTSMLTRAKLADGQYVCGKCTSKIPSEIMSNLGEYTYEDYKELLRYMEESETSLSKAFKETHSFYSIHIDTQHGLFYLDTMYPTVYLKFENLSDFNLTFDPDEVKEGLLGDKVTGKIYYKVKMNTPSFFIDNVLARNVKARAHVKTGIFKDKVEYDNPKGMNEFLHYFESAWDHAKNELYERLARELEEEGYQSQYGYTANQGQSYGYSDELRQAMALFMIDDLGAVTLSDIKAQRNRLIKAYHPDTGSASDTPFAQKINTAYEVLKGYLS